MAYDDGYYYGQCKIVAVVDNTADNGKTVLITTDDNKTYSGTIVNKKCEVLLPPRTLYTVQKVSSGSTEFTTKVEAGYGDCILVHLDTGYVEVKQGDIVGLDYIKAATDANLKNKVPEAKAVKEVNNSLIANSKHFYFDYKNGKYGYNTNPNRGADTFVPFKNGGISEFTFNSTSSFSAEIGAKYDIICATAYNQNAKSKLQGATIINEYCEYNLSNAGYLYCAEIEATKNVVSFAGVSSIGLGYFKK